MNALCDELLGELNHCLNLIDNNAQIGAIILTGSEKAFAAGADIKEMSEKNFQYAYKTNMLA